jgi:hypothetical protein
VGDNWFGDGAAAFVAVENQEIVAAPLGVDGSVGATVATTLVDTGGSPASGSFTQLITADFGGAAPGPDLLGFNSTFVALVRSDATHATYIPAPNQPWSSSLSCTSPLPLAIDNDGVDDLVGACTDGATVQGWGAVTTPGSPPSFALFFNQAIGSACALPNSFMLRDMKALGRDATTSFFALTDYLQLRSVIIAVSSGATTCTVAPFRVTTAAVGRLDGDAASDLALSAEDGAVHVLFGDGAGGLSDRGQPALTVAGDVIAIAPLATGQPADVLLGLGHNLIVLQNDGSGALH